MLASEIDLSEAYGGVQHSAHRGPREAGAADRYYGREFKPNFIYKGLKFSASEMTPEQRDMYLEGWASETERKEW